MWILDTLLMFAALFCVLAVVVVIMRITFCYRGIKRIKRMIARNGVPDLCCCGDIRDNHGWGTGHAFVSQDDYFFQNASKHYRV
ncbi:putative membrane protein [Vibrio phage vB_VchM_Kuja]|uniref:Putative membrane protein n=1 Tax=Vibrio phage vB_VchM_Kuja TaxID=2686437 RepID=A0A6B9JAV5_9CAUD|nr:hypothetical protein HWC83_gp131 [Vibrio phage vB_VchM_Kuja]QGZ16096.1 putative membrane protein [Vibrio phage vB_VchM_Kuja]